jgi:hypothetical protein
MACGLQVLQDVDREGQAVTLHQEQRGLFAACACVCAGKQGLTWWCQLQLLDLDVRGQDSIEVHHQAIRLYAVRAANKVQVCDCTCGMRACVSAAGTCRVHSTAALMCCWHPDGRAL